MRVELSLTKREADEVLRCELRLLADESVWALRQTVAQRSATFKLRQAVLAALREERP